MSKSTKKVAKKKASSSLVHDCTKFPLNTMRGKNKFRLALKKAKGDISKIKMLTKNVSEG